MNGAQYALAALVGERPDAERRRRGQRRQVALTALAGLIGLAAALWISIQAGLYGWQAADWDRFEAATALLMPTVMLVMFPFVWLPFVRAPRALSGQPLREMIVSADARLSPPLPLQPAPPPAEALGIAHSFTALRRPQILWEMRDRLLPWMIVLPVSMPVAIQLPRALGLDRLFDYRSPLSFLPLVLGIGVFFVYMIAISRTFSSVGPRWRIVADAAGVTWSAQRFPRAEWQAPWAAARSFTVAPYVDVSGWGASGLVYTLDTDQGPLSWLLVPYANAAARTEADTLARLIVTRTGLPLRDLGVWMARIKAAGGNLNALRDAGMPPDAVANFQAGCPEHVPRDAARARPRAGAALSLVARGRRWQLARLAAGSVRRPRQACLHRRRVSAYRRQGHPGRRRHAAQLRRCRGGGDSIDHQHRR